MRVTVAGASGLVGANLVRALLSGRALLANDVTVRAADLHRSAGLDGLDVEFVTTDVVDPDGLTKALDGTDVVFHLAAMISIAGDPRGLARRSTRTDRAPSTRTPRHMTAPNSPANRRSWRLRATTSRSSSSTRAASSAPTTTDRRGWARPSCSCATARCRSTSAAGSISSMLATSPMA
ncbi:MAG: NAD-dependent epimerase/dehydratase family protein [Microthrixaceae bacterium]